MKHEMTISFSTLFNIACAAAAYYKEYQQKMPEFFDEQDADELKTAIKIRKFCIETNANAFIIKDAE